MAMQRRDERQSKQPNNKNGIIRGMKKNAKSALALALAIAGAFAAPLCSDAALDSIAPTTVQSVVASNEARAEKGLAFVLDVLAGWRGESAFASAEVQDHGEGAAGDCEWVGYSTTLYSTKGVRPFCFKAPRTPNSSVYLWNGSGIMPTFRRFRKTLT